MTNDAAPPAGADNRQTTTGKVHRWQSTKSPLHACRTSDEYTHYLQQMHIEIELIISTLQQYYGQIQNMVRYQQPLTNPDMLVWGTVMLRSLADTIHDADKALRRIAVDMVRGGYLEQQAVAQLTGYSRNTISAWVRRDKEAFPDGKDATAMTEPATNPEPQPVAAAIVTSKLGVLAGKRNDGKPPWTFIAGEIEPGESPADAAIREVKEEAGLQVAVSHVIGRRVHPKTGRTMIYLACQPTDGTDVHVGDPEELSEVRWLSLTEADQLLTGMYEPVHKHLATMIG